MRPHAKHPESPRFYHRRKMPRDGKLLVEVLVEERPLEEYSHDGKYYVEMNLQTASSYDCAYEDETPHGLERSNWPVTPFQVRVHNDHPVEHFWAELRLDGEFVDQQLCKSSERGELAFAAIEPGTRQLADPTFARPLASHLQGLPGSWQAQGVLVRSAAQPARD